MRETITVNFHAEPETPFLIELLGGEGDTHVLQLGAGPLHPVTIFATRET